MRDIARKFCLFVASFFQAPDIASLPLKVRQEIEDSERQSEILIGLIQLAAVCFFGVLYTISPKAFDDSVTFEPVPVALGFYAIFTIVRTIFAFQSKLGKKLLVLSIFVDIFVLLAMIWSFHLQYQQPAAFYVKAPTMMYLFILIALRALRADPFYVIVTGLLAAIGWFGMVLYAVLDSSGPMITRDYVTYANSLQILVGAEIDKIVSLLAVTMVLTIAIIRQRKLLLVAVLQQNTAAALSRYFSPEVADEISRADKTIEAGQGREGDATIMFVDIRGFTSYSRATSAAAALALLGDYQKTLCPIITAHGGSIDKFVGDGILASFGATRHLTSHAAIALAVALELLDSADAWNRDREDSGEDSVRIGIALSTGQVLTGPVGYEDRLEFTVIGDPVNQAAKLEDLNKVLKSRLIVHDTTWSDASGELKLKPHQRFLPDSHLFGPGQDPTTFMVLDE